MAITTITTRGYFGYPSSRKIVRDSNGTLYVVITNWNQSTLEFYKSTDNGNTWSLVYTYSPENVSTDVCIDLFGTTLYVGYIVNGNSRSAKFNTSNNTLTYATSHAGLGGSAHGHAIKAVDSTTVYRFGCNYVSYPFISLAYSTDSGNSWTTQSDLLYYYGGPYPFVPGDNVISNVVTYYNGSNYRLYCLKGAGTNPAARLIYQPSSGIIIDITSKSVLIKSRGANIGRVWTAFRVRHSTSGYYDTYVAYSDDNGNNWSTPVNVTNKSATETTYSPNLAEDDAGNVYLFYGKTGGIYVRVCPNGSTSFGSETLAVSYTFGSSFNYAISVTERAYNNKFNIIALTPSGGTVHIDYALNQPPSAPTNLSPSGGAKINPSVSNNFTFRYSDPDGNSMSSYRISYRESGGSWLNTGWISKSATSGSTVTHTFNAGTFAVDKTYEWYVEVQDNAGATSPASATATFSTSQSPTATANSPGSTSAGSAPKLNVRSGVTFSWSYSDPNGNPQAEYEIEIVLDATGTVYRTVTGTGTATSTNVTGISDIGDPVYRWRIRVKDSTGRWSSWSSYRYFKAFQPYQPTGTFEKVLDFGAHTNPATISWDVSVPSGTSFKMEYALSADGVNYDPWVEVTNAGGSAIPALKRYLKYRATFTASSDGLSTPELRSVAISTNTQYYASGEWLSPVYNFTDTNAGELKVTWADNVPAGTSVQVQLRYGDDSTALGDWETLTKDQSVPANKLHYQFKVLFTSSGIRETTATLNSITMSFTQVTKRGYWQSQTVDVTNAKDLSTGKITLTYESTDAIMIQSRSSTDGGNTFSQWYDTAADGALRHPPGGHVQVRVVFSGYDSKVDEVTLFFDGEASLSTILTGMTPGSEYSFATLRDTLVAVNGRDAPKKWTGDGTLTDLGGVPPIMSMVVTHHNRVWGVDAQNQSRVRFSNILDPETWDVLDFFDFNPEDGDRITALMRYGQNLIVSKQRSMALLTGNKKENYSITWLDSEQGCTGPRAICQADRYVAYVAQDGIRFTDLNTSVIATERLIPSWNQINKRRLNQAAVVYWRNYLFAAMPENGSTVNNVVWAFDFLRNAWAIYRGWNVSAWTKFQQYGEEVLFAADSMTGQVYQITTDRYDDTIPVTYKWRSKEFHFGAPERYKLFRNIYLDIEGAVEESELAVTLYVDGEARGTYRTTIPAGEGVKHVRRILPPLYNAVLGRQISIGVEGRCGIQAIHIEYIVRGAVPGGDL